MIYLYSLFLNEEKMLPYFFRHYDSIVDKYFLYDNNSTDNSLEIIRSNKKAIVKTVSIDGDSFIAQETLFYNHVWKSSRGVADWVILPNLDEHIYVDNIPKKLNTYQQSGITAINMEGFEMVSSDFPVTDQRLCDFINTGVRWTQMDKLLIFDPNKIEDINYNPGRHTCTPRGVVRLPDLQEFKLLHYKYLGFEYLNERHQFLRKGLRAKDIEGGSGHKYQWSIAERKADFERVLRESRVVI